MTSTAKSSVVIVDVHQLAAVVRNRIDNVLIIDSRSFLEFNTCHVIGAVNVCCSKIVKRRLQQDKVTVKELLVHSCQCDSDDSYDIVVYDQSSKDAEGIPTDSFMSVLLQKLLLVFRSINLVSGGFLEFQAAYPNLCEDKTRKCAPLTSLSQPCLSISNQGPTRILPFLYLGSQSDALNKELLKDHNISYELNVSTSCPKPDHILDAQFLRIPVNDNYSEKLLPHFPKAFQFLDKVRQGAGNVLVHCLAGISRSPTVAIAYVMKHMRMTSDDAYRYVKSKRVTISPNFNFLGQLLEYEKQLRRDRVLDCAHEPKSAPILNHSQKRLCRTDMRKIGNLTLNLPKTQQTTNVLTGAGDQSPTTALAKLSFGTEDKEPEEMSPILEPDWTLPFCLSRSVSCSQDWLSVKEDSFVEQRDREQVVPRRRNLEDILHPREASNAGIGSGGKCFTKPYRISEGVVPGTLETLPQVDEIECEEVEDTNKCAKGADHVLNSSWKPIPSGLPISSLRELNFTACQTSSEATKIVSPTEKFDPAALVGETGVSPSSEIPSGYKLCKSPGGLSSYGPAGGLVKQTVKEKTFWECRTTTTSYHHYSSSASTSAGSNSSAAGKVGQWCGLQSPVSDTQMDLKFEAKDYNRSDSASTSGLGSESSDGLDSWSECPSIDHRLKDEGLTDNLVMRRFANEQQFSLSLPKKKFCPPAQSAGGVEPVKSPISPSERHFLEDMEDAEVFPEVSCAARCSSSNTNKPNRWKENELESSQDSGILNSPLWDVPEYDTASILAYFKPLDNDSPSSSAAFNLRKRKQIATGYRPKVASQISVASESSDTTTDSSLSKVSLEASHIPKTRDGLYRAQSCPGILCWLQRTPSAERVMAADFVAPPKFMRQQRPGKEHTAKLQNRYSCGSLDQYNYEKYSPDYANEGNNKKGSSSSLANAERSSLSPSHRAFRPSVDMIPVS